MICRFQPGENSLRTWCDCTSQLTHVGFLKRTVFDEKEALIVVIPWPSSFRDAGLSDHVQMQKVHHVHQMKQIPTENFDLTQVYKVSQLTLSMDISDGISDRYDALAGAFCREDKKEIY